MDALQELLVNGNVQAVMAVAIIGLAYLLRKIYNTGREDVKELVGKLEAKNEKIEKLQEKSAADKLEIALAYQRDVQTVNTTMEKLAVAVDTLARSGRA